jgi:hypothetical protein
VRSSWHFALSSELFRRNPSHVPAHVIASIWDRTSPVNNSRLIGFGAVNARINLGPKLAVLSHDLGRPVPALALRNAAPSVLPRAHIEARPGLALTQRAYLQNGAPRTVPMPAHAVQARMPMMPSRYPAPVSRYPAPVAPYRAPAATPVYRPTSPVASPYAHPVYRAPSSYPMPAYRSSYPSAPAYHPSYSAPAYSAPVYHPSYSAPTYSAPAYHPAYSPPAATYHPTYPAPAPATHYSAPAPAPATHPSAPAASHSFGGGHRR